MAAAPVPTVGASNNTWGTELNAHLANHAIASTGLLHNILQSSADTNTYIDIGDVGADTFRIVTGGSEALRVDSSQNVGIGTASPADIVHAKGDVNSKVQFRVENENAGAAAYASLYAVNDGSAGFAAQVFSSGYTGTWGGVALANAVRLMADSGMSRMLIGTGGVGDDLHFLTEDIVAMTIDGANQNVGIGTNSPGYKIHAYSGGNTISMIEGVNGAVLRLYDGTTYAGFNVYSDHKLHIGTSESPGINHLVIDTSGNVGFGTDSPDSILNTSGTGNQFAYFDSYSATDAIKASVGLRKSSNGTNGVEQETTDGEALGVYGFYGCDTNPVFNLSAYMKATQNGSASSGRVPSNLSFHAANTAGSLATAIMTIVGPDRSVVIGDYDCPLIETGTPGLAVLGTTGTANIVTGRWGGSVGGRLYLTSSRAANPTANSIVQDDDRIGEISFIGDDGVDLNSLAGEIRCEVDGTPGADDMPGRLTFLTTADGSATPTERVRIDSAGNILGVSAGQDFGSQNQTNTGVTYVGGDSGTNSMDDNETFTVTIGDAATIMLTDANGRSAVVHATYDSATITELSDPSNVYAMTDSDAGGWAVYKSATSNTVTVKNYTNATKQMKVQALGVITAATASS